MLKGYKRQNGIQNINVKILLMPLISKDNHINLTSIELNKALRDYEITWNVSTQKWN